MSNDMMFSGIDRLDWASESDCRILEERCSERGLTLEKIAAAGKMQLDLEGALNSLEEASVEVMDRDEALAHVYHTSRFHEKSSHDVAQGVKSLVSGKKREAGAEASTKTDLCREIASFYLDPNEIRAWKLRREVILCFSILFHVSHKYFSAPSFVFSLLALFSATFFFFLHHFLAF